MSIQRDDLIQAFWRRVPSRVAEATELWLAVEGGAKDQLPTLRRLLHTVKGEAQMLGLHEPGEILELSEKIVDIIRKTDEVPADIGDVLLSAIESIGLLASNLDAEEPLELSEVRDQLKEAYDNLPTPSEEAAPQAAEQQRSQPTEQETSQHPQPQTQQGAGQQAQPSQGEAEEGEERSRVDASALELVQDFQPLLHELRRLHGEQGLLLPQLREIQRILRALLAEIDPALSGEALKERIVKTLGYGSDMERRLSELRAAWSANEFSTSLTLEQLENKVHSVSLVSTDDIKQQIHRVARSTAKSVGKEVTVEVQGNAYMDTAIEQRLRPCLLHLVRNAVDHGLEPPETRQSQGKTAQGMLAVEIAQKEQSLEVIVQDDGGGVNFEALREKAKAADPDAEHWSDSDLLKVLFQHGVTTRQEVTEISGRGVGLDVVAREVRAVGGDVQVDSTRGEGSRFAVMMPVTLRADLVVPVICDNQQYALPSRSIQQVFRVPDTERTPEGPKTRIEREGRTELIPVFSLSHLLHGQGEPQKGDAAVVVQHRAGLFAVTVGSYENPRPVTFQRTEDLAFDSGVVRGVAPRADGGVLLLLDVDAVISTAKLGPQTSAASTGGRRVQGSHVLVVEDAPVAREILAGILRSFGLRVTEAMDGREGLQYTQQDAPDLILTDVEMPFMDGLDMVSRIKQDAQLSEIPVIVLTTKIDDDTRGRAEALGVRGFLSKQKFVEEDLKKVIQECLG
jgi:two-component system chemotaxis sensor kinase CheA